MPCRTKNEEIKFYVGEIVDDGDIFVAKNVAIVSGWYSKHLLNQESIQQPNYYIVQHEHKMQESSDGSGWELNSTQIYPVEQVKGLKDSDHIECYHNYLIGMNFESYDPVLRRYCPTEQLALKYPDDFMECNRIINK